MPHAVLRNSAAALSAAQPSGTAADFVFLRVQWGPAAPAPPHTLNSTQCLNPTHWNGCWLRGPGCAAHQHALHICPSSSHADWWLMAPAPMCRPQRGPAEGLPPHAPRGAAQQRGPPGLGAGLQHAPWAPEAGGQPPAQHPPGPAPVGQQLPQLPERPRPGCASCGTLWMEPNHGRHRAVKSLQYQPVTKSKNQAPVMICYSAKEAAQTPLARRLSGSSFLNSQHAHALGEPPPPNKDCS